jgi:hypothetical protein
LGTLSIYGQSFDLGEDIVFDGTESHFIVTSSWSDPCSDWLPNISPLVHKNSKLENIFGRDLQRSSWVHEQPPNT